MVLRVSRIFARVPATASTKRRVRVAMPDMRWRKLSATRSAVRMPRAGPSMDAIRLPGAKRSPSRARAPQAMAPSVSWNTAKATSRPAMTRSCLATKAAAARCSAGTVASVVTSPSPTSSASAARTRSRSTSGCTVTSAQGGTRVMPLPQLVERRLETPAAVFELEHPLPALRHHLRLGALHEARVAQALLQRVHLGVELRALLGEAGRLGRDVEEPGHGDAHLDAFHGLLDEPAHVGRLGHDGEALEGREPAQEAGLALEEDAVASVAATMVTAMRLRGSTS